MIEYIALGVGVVLSGREGYRIYKEKGLGTTIRAEYERMKVELQCLSADVKADAEKIRTDCASVKRDLETYTAKAESAMKSLADVATRTEAAKTEFETLHQKVVTELKTLADDARQTSVAAVNDIKAFAGKVAKTINRQVCSVCTRKVWQFEEYADGTVICKDCAAKGAKK